MDDQSPQVDYRFHLANERTYLAWIRTSLGLTAGGIALDQFVKVPGGQRIVDVLAILVILVGAAAAVLGSVRWWRTDRFMRELRPMPRSRGIVVVGILMALVAVAVALAIGLT